MLADRRGDLIEVSLRGPIRCRLYLIVLTMFETIPLSDMLCTIYRIVYLQVLQCDLLLVRCLFVSRLKVDVRVLRALEPALSILRSFLTHSVVVIGAFRDQTVFALVLVHNSVKRSHIIIAIIG